MISISRHLLTLILLVVPAFAVVKISVPHDIQPGYSIKKLHSEGRINLIENDVSPYFTLLSDGSLISTAKLSHLAGRHIELVIEEERGNGTVFQPFVIHVRNRSRMLSFPKPEYHGYIYENELPNSVVKIGGPLTVLNPVGNVSYSLISSSNSSSSSNFHISKKDDILLLLSVKELDRETQKLYLLSLNATDSDGSVASTSIKVYVKDINDNAPVFYKSHYKWNIPLDTPIYSRVGVVKATDADGDKVVYAFANANKYPFVIVPQTGEILLGGELEPRLYELMVLANDNREPKLYSEPIPVIISVDNLDVSDTRQSEQPLKRQKRAVRQTRTYEHFLESDGSTPGKVMFRLDSVHPDEVFSLENESRWIDVDHNGDVKVKEPWDYEQLEREKTIDFWVKIRAPQQPGK
ncbi:Neural-cadherin [Araneus ventricosus]|uniref:Neural-cadherin n=1 Tax=Araneus ventricosus TaxID=182803 RepID=A0A4Y2PY33_ARAVE|nr:Neural-cadherin [Araneus ventricosus]